MMTLAFERVQVGAATVTLIGCGTLAVSLAEWLPIPPADWPPSYAQALAQPVDVPILCVHIALGARSLLVDACHPALVPLGFSVAPGYQPPPGLIDQLAAIGVAPSDLTEVVITHAHSDHFNGLSRGDIGDAVPTFPQARCYLGRADYQAKQAALADPSSPEALTIGVVERYGLIELVDGPRDLGDGISILPAPGETPGHQIVRVASQGQVLYCLGDLYHHLIEVEQQQHVVEWADAELTRRSRQALLPDMLAENALLTASHIAGFGRLAQAEGGYRWLPM